MSATIPDIPVEKNKRSIWDRVSIVWLVPLLAVVVALAIAWQSYYDRGPVIEVVFDSAAGVAKDETELRFRDVAVGLVEQVAFTPALDQVVVSIRLDKDIAPFVDRDAEFWIIEPEVSTQGVTGLDTVLSGVYIQGQWDDQISEAADSFQGRSNAPLLAAGQKGITLTLRSTDGSLAGNAPILYKGVEVGQIGPASISPDGFTVEAPAAIYAPYDTLVTSSTQFWDTSGFSFSVGASGAALDFESLSALIIGGVTFDTFISGSPVAGDGSTFDVYADEGAARASVFNRNEGAGLDLIATFDGNVAGLTAGAVVEFNGLKIGEVSGLNGVVESTPSGESIVRLQAVLSIQPARLGIKGADRVEAALRLLDEQVAGGLRAQLATGSLLTGGLKVQLIPTDDTSEPGIDMDARPFPRIPVTENNITDVASTAQGTLDRINNLPIEELLDGAALFFNNASLLIGSPETQAIPGDAGALLRELRGLAESEDVQAIPTSINNLVTELEATSGQARQLLVSFEEADAIGRITTTVDQISALATQLQTAVEGVPVLLARLNAIAADAEDLELDALVKRITTLVGSADTLLSGEETQALPGKLNDALTELTAILNVLQNGGAVENTNAALQAARNAAEQFADATSGLPSLLSRANQLFGQAESTLSGFEDTSPAIRDARDAMREVEKAANAVQSLARALERSPLLRR